MVVGDPLVDLDHDFTSLTELSALHLVTLDRGHVLCHITNLWTWGSQIGATNMNKWGVTRL